MGLACTVESTAVFLGCIFELVFASLTGGAVLLDTFTYSKWLGHTVLFGRLAILLGIAGLSVEIMHRTPRLGKLSRVVVFVAVVFTGGLLALSTLAGVGFTSPTIAVFGFRTVVIAVVSLGTVVLSAITYALFGIVILRTGAFSTLIGGLLLAATVPLMVRFFGLMALHTRLVLVVREGVLFILFLSIWYLLRAKSKPTDRLGSAPDMTAK